MQFEHDAFCEWRRYETGCKPSSEHFINCLVSHFSLTGPLLTFLDVDGFHSNSPSLSQPNDADGVLRTFAMDHSSVHSIPPHWTAVNSNFLSQLSVCRLLPALAGLNLLHFFFFLPAFLPLIEKHLSACCMFVGFSCSSAVSNFIAVDFSVLLMHYSYFMWQSSLLISCQQSSHQPECSSSSLQTAAGFLPPQSCF